MPGYAWGALGRDAATKAGTRSRRPAITQALGKSPAECQTLTGGDLRRDRTACPRQHGRGEPGRGASSLAEFAHDRSPQRRPSTQRQLSPQHRYKALCARPGRHGVTRSVLADRVASAQTVEPRSAGTVAFGGPLLGEPDRRFRTSGAAAGRPLPCSDRLDWYAHGCRRRLHIVQFALRVARPSSRTRSQSSLQRHLAGAPSAAPPPLADAPPAAPMFVRAVHIIVATQTTDLGDVSTPCRGRLATSTGRLRCPRGGLAR